MKIYNRAYRFAKRIDSILRLCKDNNRFSENRKRLNSYYFSIQKTVNIIKLMNKHSFRDEWLFYSSSTGGTHIRDSVVFELKNSNPDFDPNNVSTEYLFQLSMIYTDKEIFHKYCEALLIKAGWCGTISCSDTQLNRYTRALNVMMDAYSVDNTSKYLDNTEFDKKVKQ